MKRTYLWRSIVGQRLSANLTPDEFQQFGQWLTENEITDDDLTDIVRDWRSARKEGDSFLEYLDRIELRMARTASNDMPTASLRANSEMADVGR